MSLAKRLRTSLGTPQSAEQLLAHYAQRWAVNSNSENVAPADTKSGPDIAQHSLNVVSSEPLSHEQQLEYLLRHFDAVTVHEAAGGRVLEIVSTFPIVPSGDGNYRGVRLPGQCDLFETLLVSPGAAHWISRLSGDAHVSGAAPISELLFFDTETTGLARAAGTLAFLVGCGRFECVGSSTGQERWQFRCVQWLLDSPSAEPRQLELFAEELRRSGLLVTFNGRTFDVPLMLSRGIMNRSRLPLGLPHADLLPASRAVWRSQHPRCSLSALEQDVFGHTRTSDIPGADIPALWHQFTRGCQSSQMVRVLDHNLQDILTTAALSLKLLQMTNTTASSLGENFADDKQRLDVARWLSRRGFVDEAAILCSGVCANAPRYHHALQAARYLDSIEGTRAKHTAAASAARHSHLWGKHGIVALESAYRAARLLARDDSQRSAAQELCRSAQEHTRLQQAIARSQKVESRTAGGPSNELTSNEWLDKLDALHKRLTKVTASKSP